MSFSHAAAAHVVPLLSRLAIAAVMIPLGWTDLTTTSTFSGDDAAWIDRLDVAEPTGSGAVTKVAWFRQADDSPAGSPKTAEAPARNSTDPPPAATPPGEPSEARTPAAAPAESTPPTPPTSAEFDAPASDQVVTARHLHRWSILFAEAGLSGPVPLAWATALLEVIGGSLLVLGLVTRVWGVLYALLVGSLIWILGIPYTAPNYLFGADVAAFESVAAGLGMFVLSLGLALTGGGFLSLDRAIFRPRSVVAPTPGRTTPATTAATPRVASVTASPPVQASAPLPITGSSPSQPPSSTRPS